MAITRRVLSALLAAGALIAGSLTFASPAHAAEDCTSVSFWTPYPPATLCITDDRSGYRAVLYSGRGLDNLTANFGLVCSNGRWFGDWSAFQIAQFHTYSYVFAVGRQGACRVRLQIHRTEGDKYWFTPWLSK